MDDRNARIYNAISILFLLLTVGMIAFVAIMMTTTDPDDDNEAALARPTAYVTPTLTPSDTPTPSVTPSITPIPSDSPTPTLSKTPTPSETTTPTVTPSPTISDTPAPTLTPSDTPTPSASPTSTPTPTPTGPTATNTPTQSPFLFQLRSDVQFQPNQGNVAGCAWQGVAGSVFDLNGQPMQRQFRVRVFNDTLDRVVSTGTNSFYGEISGFEVQVASTINAQTYFVRLETLAGTVVSETIPITFPQDCNQNVAIVRFIQTRPFGS